MKKVPSALKWLAEKRARVAHELQQTELVLEQVRARLERLKLDQASLDRVIQVYDPSIDPQTIAPVAAWRGRYGGRGALKETISGHLRGCAPAWVTTAHLEMLVTVELQIAFPTSAERKRWYDNSFRRCLKKLVETGDVERLQDPVEHGADLGAWRWKQPEAVTLASLHTPG